MTSDTLSFVATVAPGLDTLLREELEQLGAAALTPLHHAVAFEGDLALGYRVCLWSRLASRLLLRLSSFDVLDGDSLYAGSRESVRWLDHLDPSTTIAVDADGATPGVNHTHYAALRVKDAIVDQLREATGRRPNVDSRTPDLRLHVYLHDGRAQLSIDIAGTSLHRRGYRPAAAPAPLKETLAAALLLLADWPRRAQAGEPFFDPMCGSGTLPVEAALIAADVAPGLLRQRFGFDRWSGHDAAIWRRVRHEAKARDRRSKADNGQAASDLPIFGCDGDPRAVQSARQAVDRAGLERWVRIEQRELALAEPPVQQAGLLLFNPPYGKRLGQVAALKPLYRQIGRLLRERFAGWTACVLSGEPELSRCLGLKATRKHVVYNGTLPCRLLVYPLAARTPGATARATAEGPEVDLLRLTRSANAQTFANRLRKNARHFGRWARRSQIECYRVYDADIPEYAAAIDIYGRCAHVQEYAPPREIDSTAAEDRLHDIVLLTAGLLDLPEQQIYLKVRQRQRGSSQYQPLDAPQRAVFQVAEGGHRFRVNLSDYLDTGLFPDQRQTRALLQQQTADRHFLNLFCYTASATVYAAKGGAKSTTSVDLSTTYLDWARANLQLNGIRASSHRLVQADCLEWVRLEKRRYGLIYLEPPTFSTSKRMRRTFDVQRDHVELIQDAARLLTPDGILVFASNCRGFKIDREALASFNLQDLSRATLPPDFARNPRLHHVWRIERQPKSG